MAKTLAMVRVRLMDLARTRLLLWQLARLAEDLRETNLEAAIRLDGILARYLHTVGPGLTSALSRARQSCEWSRQGNRNGETQT